MALLDLSGPQSLYGKGSSVVLFSSGTLLLHIIAEKLGWLFLVWLSILIIWSKVANRNPFAYYIVHS